MYYFFPLNTICILTAEQDWYNKSVLCTVKTSHEKNGQCLKWHVRQQYKTEQIINSPTHSRRED